MSAEQPTDGRIETWAIKFIEPKSFDGMNMIKGDWLAEHGTGAVSWSALNAQLKRLSSRVVNLLTKQDHANAKVFADYAETVEKRLLESARSIRELEAAQSKSLADSFRGTWMPGSVFVRGSLAVHDGSLWLSLADSDQKPGTSADWKLICKKGRDGKDLRS